VLQEWISVLPTNQWGEIIRKSAAQAGVLVDRISMVEGEVGIFFVLPVRHISIRLRMLYCAGMSDPGVCVLVTSRGFRRKRQCSSSAGILVSCLPQLRDVPRPLRRSPFKPSV
jgi:hypothetical protein